MKSKSFRSMGSVHPLIFMAGMYLVALIFSIFICSSLFYSCNANGSTHRESSGLNVKADLTEKQEKEMAIR